MRRTITVTDLDLLNLILSRDPALADHVTSKLDALAAALGPVAPPEPVPAAESKRPRPDTSGDDQSSLADRENHARIVTHLRTLGPMGPGEIQAALGIKGSAWARALAGTPRIYAEGKGAGRKYTVER